MGKVKDLSIEFSPLIKVWKAKDGEFDATISNNLLPEYVESKLTRKEYTPHMSILGRYTITNEGECRVVYANYVNASDSIPLDERDRDILGMYIEVFLIKRRKSYEQK